MGECHGRGGTGVARTNRGTAAWLLVAGALATASAYFVSDGIDANLQLAPVFFGAALAVAAAWVYRSRSRRGRHRLLRSGGVLAADRSPGPPG